MRSLDETELRDHIAQQERIVEAAWIGLGSFIVGVALIVLVGVQLWQADYLTALALALLTAVVFTAYNAATRYVVDRRQP